MNRNDVIAWYEEKSREYAESARRLREDIPLAAEVPPLSHIVSYLQAKGAKRPADIATVLNTTKAAVLQVAKENPTLFTFNSRGWLKLTP